MNIVPEKIWVAELSIVGRKEGYEMMPESKTI